MHVGVAGQRGEHAAERRVDRLVDVLERAREQRALAAGGLGGELREIPELVAGEVRGAERQPDEVVALAAEQLDRGVGDARRAPRRASSRSASSSRAVGRPKISVACGPRAVAPGELRAPAARGSDQRGSTTRSANCQPQTYVPRQSRGGRLSYGSIASVRSPARASRSQIAGGAGNAVM